MRAESTRVVLEVPLEEVSFSKVLIPLAHAENIFMKETNPLVFYASAHPDEDVRLASAEAQILIDDFAVEQALFEPLFRLIDAVVRKEERLDDESARYLATKHRNFVRHGMLLGDEPSHQRLRELRREIARDSSQFHANLTNADGGVWYPREALDGVPERILDSMEVGTGEKEGLLKVSFKNSHLAGVLRYAKRAEIRREFFIANENQLPENVELFRNVVLRRDEVARLLAYGSHAALKLEERMAGSTVVVERFHEDLRMKLQETGVSEGEKLRALKAAELGIDAEKKKVDYWLWDQPYYNRLMVERNYQIDQEKISEWFPLQIVVQRMLAIFEDIFALKFVLVNPLDASQGERPEVWHEDVQVYATYDGDDGGSFMGWLYMDLYTRDGKREQSGNYSLVPVRVPSHWDTRTIH
jgi:metallopeptidase MepB